MSSLFHLTSCTSTKSNLYLANSLGTVVSEPDLYRLLTLLVLISCPFSIARPYQRISSSLRHVYPFCNKASFYVEELLAPCPYPKLEDHPLLAVRDRLFNIFAATLYIGGRSFICNLRMCHTVVTGTHLSWLS